MLGIVANQSSSKSLKMEAYDTAVLRYALATAACKLKPGLLGIAPNIPAPRGGSIPVVAEESLTPPAPRQADNADGNKPKQDALVRMLASLEQSFLNRIPVQLPQMLEMCALKQVILLRIKSFCTVPFKISMYNLM